MTSSQLSTLSKSIPCPLGFRAAHTVWPWGLFGQDPYTLLTKFTLLCAWYALHSTWSTTSRLCCRISRLATHSFATKSSFSSSELPPCHRGRGRQSKIQKKLQLVGFSYGGCVSCCIHTSRCCWVLHNQYLPICPPPPPGFRCEDPLVSYQQIQMRCYSGEIQKCFPTTLIELKIIRLL